MDAETKKSKEFASDDGLGCAVFGCPRDRRGVVTENANVLVR